jgi:hypothetical protein
LRLLADAHADAAAAALASHVMNRPQPFRRDGCADFDCPGLFYTPTPDAWQGF